MKKTLKKVFTTLLAAAILTAGSSFLVSAAETTAGKDGGWQLKENEWHYILNDGTPYTGWVLDQGKWYYTDYGILQADRWIREKNNDRRYHVNADGVMAPGYIDNTSGFNYYTGTNGWTVEGWIKIDDGWYYGNPALKGQLAINDWQLINNQWYLFDYSGEWIEGTPESTGNIQWLRQLKTSNLQKVEAFNDFSEYNNPKTAYRVVPEKEYASIIEHLNGVKGFQYTPEKQETGYPITGFYITTKDGVRHKVINRYMYLEIDGVAYRTSRAWLNSWINVSVDSPYPDGFLK